MRVLIASAAPEPAEDEPLDAGIARGEVVCSPRAATWARARLAIEDGEVDAGHQTPWRRAATTAERDEQARAVQYTLFGTPAPGAVQRPGAIEAAEDADVFSELEALFADVAPDEQEEDLREDGVVEETAADEPSQAAPQLPHPLRTVRAISRESMGYCGCQGY
jgi:hypothetical protein